jgi:hypothetical protein
MISTNVITNQTQTAEPIVSPQAEASTSNEAETARRKCRWYLDRVVGQIPSPKVRRIVGTVFQDLTRLLECLSIIERHLRHVNTSEESFAFFQLIRNEARSLVEFIRTDALTCDSIPEDLADALDGITFALSHDLRRVFENEDSQPDPDKTAYTVLSRVHRAHDVLTNCLQQSTITLALVFDRELEGATLFNNSDKRYRESLKLCEDLSMLRHLVDALAKGGSQFALRDLMACLEKFRGESMEFLMYSDWPQFESFCERIEVAGPDKSSLAPVLHQFQCYLETLLGQVRMRAVLADEYPASLGEQANHMWPATTEPDVPPQDSEGGQREAVSDEAAYAA